MTYVVCLTSHIRQKDIYFKRIQFTVIKGISSVCIRTNAFWNIFHNGLSARIKTLVCILRFRLLFNAYVDKGRHYVTSWMKLCHPLYP